MEELDTARAATADSDLSCSEQHALLPRAAAHTGADTGSQVNTTSPRMTIALSLAPMLALLLLGLLFRHQLMLWVATFAESLRGRGLAGMLLYLVAFVVWLLLCAPSTPYELVGGYVYPLPRALLLNVIGKWAGSSCVLF